MKSERAAVAKTGKGVLPMYRRELGPGRLVADNQTQNQFDDLYRMYANTLTELCVNRFKWENLPESVDPRFLEMTLFRSALSVFYFDDRYERFLSLRGNGAGRWNVYDNPTSFQVTGNSMINRTVLARDCVPIWGNATRTPDTDVVAIYARKLANIDRTFEINAESARRTKVMAVPENQRLSGQAYVDQINRGDPIIFVNKAAYDPTDGSLSALDLGIHPDHLINLDMVQTRLWSKVMGLLGIDNANQDKKERQVVAEVSANDGQTDNMRRVFLNAREYACDQINRKWGLDIGVSFHVDDTPSEDGTIIGELMMDEDNNQGGVSGGDVHNRAIQS